MAECIGMEMLAEERRLKNNNIERAERAERMYEALRKLLLNDVFWALTRSTDMLSTFVAGTPFEFEAASKQVEANRKVREAIVRATELPEVRP